MYIKTTMTYHSTSTGLAIIRKGKVTDIGRDVETLELMHCWWHCWYSHYKKTVWRVLKKLKTELPYDPAVLLLDIYLKKTRTLI